MAGWDKPYQVIRRRPGTWVKGEYVPSAVETAEGVMGSHQPSRIYDYSTLAAQPGGRRYTLLYRFYTNAELHPAKQGDNGHPGDLVMVDGERFLVVGVAEWRVLPGATNHGRYLITNELEHGTGEVV
jgi:hypothetical protein